uniref:IST1 homolog n=1 Tax=Timema californicum TaxID=61474 RepID=A0A7R9P9P0_TIMCA|nr:unnamed protein product [Timema californicum]
MFLNINVFGLVLFVLYYRNLDEGLSEAISSVLWVAPRLQADVPEMKMISDMLTAKYGKPYAEACRKGSVPTIPERIQHKMSIQSPPALLVEKYLIEIAKNYNIEFTPDPQVTSFSTYVMKEDQQTSGVDALLDLNDSDTNNLGGGQGPPQPAGFVGFPQPPMLPSQQPSDFQNFNIHGSPNSTGNVVGFITPPPLPRQGPSAPFTQGHGVPLSYNIPPGSESTAASPGQVKHLNTNILQYVSLMLSHLARKRADYLMPLCFASPHPSYAGPSQPTNYHKLSRTIAPRLYKLKGLGRGRDDTVKFDLSNLIEPKPSPRPKITPGENEAPSFMDLPELPAVPDDSLHPPGGVHTDDADEIDFDDLTRRFEDLKKKK